MSLSEEIASFRVNLANTLSCLHTIHQASDAVLKSTAEEVSLELARLQDLLSEVSDYHQSSINYLVEIDQQWGSGQFSTLPTLTYSHSPSANTRLSNKSNASISINNDTNIKNSLLSALSLGLPPALALKIAETSSDTLLTRTLITTLQELGIDASEYDPEKARKQLSRVWITTAFGDQGELDTLKSLLDEGFDLEEIQLKSNVGGLNPDFYIPSRSLVCDAKAYKEMWNRRYSLVEVFEKYSTLLPNGGEVRLYFPQDTYKKEQKKFNKYLRNEIQKPNNVKWEICSMNSTYSDLKIKLTFLYHYLTQPWD